MTRRGPTALIVCGYLGLAGPAHADTVTDWNAIAVPAVGIGRPGPVGNLDQALVQAAMHDAVQAIEGRFEPYHVEMSGAAGSREAATAAAAYHVLIGIYPSQAEPPGGTLTATYEQYLDDHGLRDDPGLEVGQDVADAYVLLRRNPPSPLPPDNRSNDPGRWRPTDSFLNGATAEPGPPFGPPAPFSPGAFPWMATAAPFTLNSPDQFRMGPPPALTSNRYRKEYDEVKAMGSRLNSARTDEQTDLAYFYADGFAALWWRTLRTIALEHVHDIGDSARLFALEALAAADSGITAWDSKYHYNMWRPLTAIREGDDDDNPRTVGDPNWEPLLNTPNYPDHSSGANNLTGGMTRTLELFFGKDKFTFRVSSNFPRAIVKEREYKRFSDMAEDVVNVRIYQGIHFRTPDDVGREQGRRVADWVFANVLRPVE